MGVKGAKYKTPRYSVDRTTTQKGERHWRSRLTEEDVKLIITLLDEGLSQAEIGRKFDVPRQVIHGINAGKSWRCVVA